MERIGGLPRRLRLCLFSALPLAFSVGCGSALPALGSPSQPQEQVTSTRCPGTSIWTGQGCTTPSSSLPSQPRVAQSTTTRVPDERAQRLRDYGRTSLTKRGTSSPYPCDDGWLAGPAGWVVDVTPWAEAAGLRRGDKIVAIGGISTAESGDWGEALARIPKAERFSMRVERSGRTLEVVLPCRDNTPWWTEQRRMYEAMAAGRWSDCMDAAARLVEIARRPFTIRSRWECWRSKIVEERSQAPAEFWIAMYQIMTKDLETAKYVPGYLGDARSRILEGIRTLEQRGFQQYADDLRTQLQNVATAPPEAAPKEEHVRKFTRSGTAFVVRPDGLLVTAFHVVQDADAIVVACPGKEPVPAGIESSSATTDLVLLRTRAVMTPDYLSFSDPRVISVGAKVFTVGYPAPELLGKDAKFSEGVISSLSGPGGDASFLQTTVAAHGGNSGGPLVNEHGEVVGVVIATASAPGFLKITGNLPQNINWAVKGAYASSLFDAPPKLRTASDRNAAIQRTVKATCLVITEGEEPQK
jgi:S1-C subfamily serine protease